MPNEYLYYSAHFFEILRSWPTIELERLTSFLLFAFFGLFFYLELHFPYKKWSVKNLLQSCRTNFNLFLFNNLLLSLLSASGLLILAEQFSKHGLLNHFSSPISKFLLSFLILDFMLYLWHVASHKYQNLWMFHKVHHSDPYLNISTAFRLHILEFIITTCLKAMIIVILGIDKMTVLITETLTTVFIMFHHTNISFAGEKLISKLIIMPYIHRSHHSIEPAVHDNNYGAVLSIWDYCFGTLLIKENTDIGLKNNAGLGFIEQLQFGFSNTDTPKLLVSNLINELIIHQMINEAAYFAAEKREFYPGAEIDDWLKAEHEIHALVLKSAPKTKNKLAKQYNLLSFISNWSSPKRIRLIT